MILPFTIASRSRDVASKMIPQRKFICDEPPFNSVFDRRVVICLALVLYALGGWLSQTRSFDQDEFLHLHISWSVFKGLLPYRDFFDHYTPLLHVLLAPLFNFFKVETDIADAVGVFFFSRKLMWLVSAFIVGLTFWLGKLWRNIDVGLVAVVFLLGTEAYWNTALEIRPDPLAVVFWLLYLITVARAVEPDRNEKQRKRMFFWSGVFLALGFLAIQKIVYAFPGLAVGTCWYLFSPSDRATRRRRLGHVLYQSCGFGLPLVFTVTYFYLNQGFTEFVRYNFLLFLGATGFSPLPKLQQFLYQHPYLAVFGTAGVLRSLVSTFRHSARQDVEIVMLPAALALILGLFLIPFPHYQYYVLFLPLLAIFAATFLLESVLKLAALREQVSVWQWTSVAGLACVALVTALALIGLGAGSHWPLFIVVGYWLGVFLGCVTFVGIRAPTLGVMFFLTAMSVGPLTRFYYALTSEQLTPQFEEMRYIMENTAPTEAVMDGFQGSGVFRPHAYFFWFVPYHVRKNLSEIEKQRPLQGLRAGTIAPKFILFDKNLREMSPGTREFVEGHYEPVGTGLIWERRGVSTGKRSSGDQSRSDS